MGKQWEDQESDEVKTLSDILKWLRKLQTNLATGSTIGGGWTDDGTTVRLSTATDKVHIGASTAATHTLTVTGTTDVFKAHGAFDSDEIDILVGKNINGSSLDGTFFSFTEGTESVSLLIGRNSVGEKTSILSYETDAGGVTSVAVKLGGVLGLVNDDSGLDVLYAISDPEGVRIQGKDTGSTNKALTVYNGNATAFAGTQLFSVRNDGLVTIGATASNPSRLLMSEDTDNGSHGITIQSPASLAASYTLTLPTTDGSANEILTTDGSGTLSWTAHPEVYVISCSDETTAILTGTGKVTMRMPFAMTLTAVRASVTTAPTGSTIIIDINEDSGSGSASILSTKLSIDTSEKTSTTAASQAVISDTALADDAEITIDFDQVGSTIAGAGVKVYLIGTRT